MGSKQICNLSEVVPGSSFHIYAPETFCAVCVTKASHSCIITCEINHDVDCRSLVGFALATINM